MTNPRNRYEHDLLTLCGRIHGAYTGSGDGIPDDEARRWREWLTWRLDEGWETHGEDKPWAGAHAAYDGAVRQLCRVALRELTVYTSER